MATEKGKKPFATTFPQFEPEYHYNEYTGELEEVGQIDIQEKINSARESCLDYVLNQYLDVDCDSEVDVQSLYVKKDKLDFMLSAFDTADELRDLYGLGDDMSVEQVFMYANEAYQSELKKAEKNVEPVEEPAELGEVKEVKEDETL